LGIVLVTGGTKSGRGAYAEARVRALAGRPVYISTAGPQNQELRSAITARLSRLGPEWEMIATAADLCEALRTSDGAGPRLVNSIADWLWGRMAAEDDWIAQIEDLKATLLRQQSPVVLVTREVGDSVPPGQALARRFQEAAGVANQTVGAIADEIVLLVCGHPVTVKAKPADPA